MKILAVLFIIIILASCAKVNVKVEDDNWSVSYFTLFRQVEDVSAGVGKDINFSLGSAGSDTPISNEVVACMLAPSLCK